MTPDVFIKTDRHDPALVHPYFPWMQHTPPPHPEEVFQDEPAPSPKTDAPMSMAVQSQTVLDPLSDATETTMAKLNLRPQDRLSIKLDHEGRKFIVTATSIEPMLSPSWNCKEGWQKCIPECSQIRNSDVYALGGTDFTAMVLNSKFGKDRLIFQEEMAEHLFDYLLLRFMSESSNALKAAKFKLNGELPPMPASYMDHPELPLADYQKAAVACAYKKNYALFMQQGTGKTPTAVSLVNAEAIEKKQSGGKPYMCLIVCPRQVRTNWRDEFVRFSTAAGRISILKGNKIKRIEAIANAIRFQKDDAFATVICSYESLQNTWEAIGLFDWDKIILDESHYIKGPHVRRSKFCREKLSPQAKSRLILTGTPICNKVMDLWGQLEFLDEGMSGFMNPRQFKGFYQSADKSLDGSQQLEAMLKKALIRERLSRVSFMITKKEAGLKLPDKTYDVYDITMTGNQRKMYIDLQEKLMLEIEEMQSDEKNTVTAENILTKILKLTQITSGFLKYDPQRGFDGEVLSEGKTLNIPGDNPKLEAMIELLQENAVNDKNMKSIVWATFIQDIKNITEALHKAGIKFVAYHPAAHESGRVAGAEEAAHVFNNDPECMVFVGNPASASEGLNLLGYNYKESEPEEDGMYAGHMIYFSQNWSAVQRSQSEDRAHRRGMRGSLRITDLQVGGSIDEEVRGRVVLKRMLATELQDISSILDNVLRTAPDED